MLLRIFQSDSLANVQDFIGDEVPYSPAFVDGKLLDVGNNILVDFGHREGLGEVNYAVDALHADRVLVVGVKVAEYLQEFCFGGLRDQLDHVVEHERGTFPDLRDLVLAGLREQTKLGHQTNLLT